MVTKPKNEQTVEPEAQPEERLLEELKEDYPDPFLPFTEAPASINVRFEVDGLSYQATARDLNLLNAWSNLSQLVELLRAQGRVGPFLAGPQATAQPQADSFGDAPPPFEGGVSSPDNPFGGGTSQHAPVVEGKGVTFDGGVVEYNGVFDVDKIVGSYDAERGQTYWKVRGGKYVQHGVTIWPEVLEAAGCNDTSTARVIPLKGWRAYYVVNDEGNPRKVVALVRG